MITRRLVSIACQALVLIGSARNAGAQQSIADVLAFLVTNQSVDTGNPDRDRAAAQATSDAISRALLASLATLPMPTSSSAFVYRLNPAIGTVERATHSFGPFFVERALTAGAGEISFGLTVQNRHFTSLDGHNLRDGSLVTTANQFVDEQSPFDLDQLTLNIDASVATLYGNVGVTDRLEVGVAVPIVSLRVSGSRVNTYRGQTFTQATASANATGLADVVVRSKYTCFDEDGASLAAAADVHLPTGRREDLLGAGSTAVRLSGIGSLERGPVSTHANLGVSLGGLARELSYSGAVAFAASDHVTATAELFGRWIDSPGGIGPVSSDTPTLAAVQTIRLLPDSSTLHVLTLAPGVKWNLSDTWVLGVSLSIPLTNGGLTSPITPLVGLDYAFGR